MRHSWATLRLAACQVASSSRHISAALIPCQPITAVTSIGQIQTAPMTRRSAPADCTIRLRAGNDVPPGLPRHRPGRVIVPVIGVLSGRRSQETSARIACYEALSHSLVARPRSGRCHSGGSGRLVPALPAVYVLLHESYAVWKGRFVSACPLGGSSKPAVGTSGPGVRRPGRNVNMLGDGALLRTGHCTGPARTALGRPAPGGPS